MIEIACARCGASCIKHAGAVNRARNAGFSVYCTRECAGIARRVEKPPEDERKRLKSEYDAARRLEKGDLIREKKREYFRRTYDPETAAEYRKGRMPYHVEYCRRYYSDPAKKREKFEYDIRFRGVPQYADYFDAWRLLVELEREIRKRMPDKYERAKARGYYDKFKERQHGRQHA